MTSLTLYLSILLDRESPRVTSGNLLLLNSSLCPSCASKPGPLWLSGWIIFTSCETLSDSVSEPYGLCCYWGRGALLEPFSSRGKSCREQKAKECVVGVGWGSLGLNSFDLGQSFNRAGRHWDHWSWDKWPDPEICIGEYAMVHSEFVLHLFYMEAWLAELHILT